MGCIAFHIDHGKDAKVERSAFLRWPLTCNTDINTETTLNTHDLSLPIPSNKEGKQELFRVLLLSSSDTQPFANVSARIERLYHQTGGRNVGIIFLLREKGSSDHDMKEYMNLQIWYNKS